MKAANDNEYDVVISGAGLVGATLACALGGSGLRVALLDKTPPPQYPGPEYALRVSAINRASENVLERCGAWRAILERRAHPFRAVCACHEHGAGEVVFDAAELGETHLGHIVENDLIVRCLLARIAEHDNVLPLTDEVADLDRQPGSTRVQTAGGATLHARVVAACDGASSPLRTLCGAAVSGGAYQQRCIVGNIHFDGDHRRVAWQRFLSSGPLGLLPLADGCCSLAWSCRERRAHALLKMDDAAFITALDEAIGGRLGAITAVGERRSFPLSHLHAQRYVHGRTVLTGDAAHVIHPLAGLGANLGIMDAAALAAVLLRAHADGHDIGAHSMLRRYERWRHGENAVVLGVLHGFNALFTRDGDGNDAATMVLDGALRIANRAAPAKRLLARLASGLDGDLPNLARPAPARDR